VASAGHVPSGLRGIRSDFAHFCRVHGATGFRGRLRLLLAPGGVLVCSTPNLDSKQIAWFGPVWAHWHPPYHRYIFSKRGFRALAAQGMRVEHDRLAQLGWVYDGFGGYRKKAASSHPGPKLAVSNVQG